ncbi:MAG: putative bifunctional diguanylate cyclase/phosphodiesterase [Actinomycetales bacterium]
MRPPRAITPAGVRRSLRSVRGRLLLVVMLAGLMLVGVGVVQVRSSVQVATSAGRLSALADELDRLLILRAALGEEHMVTILGHLGVTAEIIGTSSRDLRIERVRARTDEAIRATDVLPRDLLTLQLARNPGGFGDEYVNLRLYRDLSDQVSRKIDQLTSQMRDSLILLGEPEAGESLDRLEAMSELDLYTGQVVIDLVDLWFADPVDDNPRSARLDASLRNLDEASAGLAPLAPDTWDGDVPPWLSAPDFDQVTEDAFRGQRVRSGAAATPTVLNGLVQGVERSSEMTTFVRNQAELDLGVVARVAGTARQQALAVAIGLPLFMLALLGLALWQARVVVRPLRHLGSAAMRLRDGQTDALGLENVRGTPEVEATAEALAAAAQSLDVLKHKAALIARGDVAGAQLQEPVPGDLGRLFDEAVTTFTTTVRDRMELAQQMEFRARHDHLTDLLSRGAVLEFLQQAVADRDTELAVAHLDLEQFRELNSVFGMPTADQVLVEVGKILDEMTRASGGAAGRLGADEFLIVLAGDQAASRIHERMAFVVNEIEHRAGAADCITSVRARVGVAVRTGEEDPADLVRMATHASDEARGQVHGAVVSFDDASRARVEADRELEVALREAVSTGQGLALWFQPLVDARTGRARGVEALCRWDRPGYGRVSPDRFITIAERSDLIVELDNWVMDQAMAQLAAWNQDPELSTLMMSINISGRHAAKRSLVPTVQSWLQRHAVPPSQVMLELTETSLAIDLRGVSERLARLRAMGVRVAVDDFGTGYTGLGQLRTLPIDELKLDRSLLPHISTDPEAWRLLSLVCGLGHLLDVSIVAEGVETQFQVGRLQGLGVDLMQGNLFALPMPPRQATGWLLESLREQSRATRIVGLDSPSVTGRPRHLP